MKPRYLSTRALDSRAQEVWSNVLDKWVVHCETQPALEFGDWALGYQRVWGNK